MEFNDMDDAVLGESERKRYNEIKAKGEYLELNVLIGTNRGDTYKEHTGRMPVISTAMHNCGPEEVACLCATLKALLDYYKKEHPMEFLFSEMAMGVENVGTAQIVKKKKED